MKKNYLFLVGLVLYAFMGFSQNAYLTKDLQNQLSNTKDQELIRINVLMQDRLDVLKLKFELNAQKANFDRRATETVSGLKYHAASSQQDLIDEILSFEHGNPGSYSDIQQLWAINMVVLNATPDLIHHLSFRNDIELMETNRSRIVQPIQHIPSKPSFSKSPGGIEPGLVAINAPALWKMGYTGRARKSFNLDTGAWTEHPAISARFLGNYYPLSESFFSLDVDFPVDKGNSHGTHTLGTTLGLDLLTHDTIGVAFNSYYLVADLVATSDATVKPLTDFVLAFEWAMDPDGNPETTADIPDVINNSWGYLPTDNTDLCDSYMNDLFIALETAGIAVVFSAGNEGPGPQTIGLPQHLNSGMVNVFTVGSISPHDAGFPISGFSSRGPTICPGEGSIKIKPEVVAPGQDIRSCIGKDAYSEYQGTSMAAPHVSGAVLLLKEAFPQVTGEEILLALYNSAIDLGDAAEDNTYGKGMIDVLAAFNYLSLDHQAVSPNSYEYDIAISEVKNPTGILVCHQNISPEIEIINKGLKSVQQLHIDYWFVDEEVSSFDWNGDLAPGESTIIDLDDIKTNHTGESELYFVISLAEEISELDMVNNRRVLRFNIREEYILPFAENFDSGSLYEKGWYTINPDMNKTWNTISVDTNDYSFHSLVMKSWGYGGAGQIDELVSPGILLPENGNIKLSFDYAYQHVYPDFVDTLKLMVSSDCGQTYSHIIFDKGGEDLSSNGVDFSIFYPTDASQWGSEEIDLTYLAGLGNVVFTFQVYSHKGNNLFIDNFMIDYDGEPYLIQESDALEFIVYPNPADNYIILQQQAMVSKAFEVSVVDMLGNTVIQKTEAGNKVKVDVSSLKTGVYILKIIHGNHSEFHKIIKK
ncbi:MAG: S8 family peptidase [Bacteroidales bacterium]|nr:S8 family peptidase [Bacteroidales bacterium]